MKAKSFLSFTLLFLGIFFVLIALISAYFTLTSFLERQSHGSGIFFADVELFGLVAIIFTILSAITIFAYKKILGLNESGK